MAANKKLVSTIAAVATSAALLLGGTLAWQSVSQTALNEASDVVNPGGRLHDDFYIDANGDYNSDIYVENFAEDEIFARVKLQEYMEVVMNYGTAGAKDYLVLGTQDTDLTSPGLNIAAKPDGTQYEREYVTHYFDVDGAAQEAGVDQKDSTVYWSWTMGSPDSADVYYMPTFNMNKDSLVADRNGMYVDRIGGISNRGPEQYEDYTVWAQNDTKDGAEIWDADYNHNDEVKYDLENLTTYVDAGNITTVDNTHTAQPVGETAGFISMDAWLAMYDNGEETGSYWVYDDNGWIYWSSPILAGSATGLLLDSIELNGVMDDTWYYAINVIGQFVTADDVGKTDGTGFYSDEAEAPDEDAERFLEAIGVDVSGEAAREPQTVYLELNYNEDASVNAQPGDSIILSINPDDEADMGAGDLSDIRVRNNDTSEDLTEGEDYTYDPDTQTLVILDKGTGYSLARSGGMSSVHVNDNSEHAYGGDVILGEQQESPVEFRIYSEYYDEGTNYHKGETAYLEDGNYQLFVMEDDGRYYAGEYPNDFEWSVDPALDYTVDEVSAHDEDTGEYYVSVLFTFDENAEYDTEYTFTATNTSDGTTMTAYVYYGEDAGSGDDVYSDNPIIVNGVQADDEGYIYLYGLNIEDDKELYVEVSAVCDLDSVMTYSTDKYVEGTYLETDESDPYIATLHIKARDYQSVTITATDVYGDSYSATVVPVYDTIIVTPAMNGSTITIPSGYYILQAEDFTDNDNVSFSVEDSSRMFISEENGSKQLNVMSYESGTDIKLIATDGSDTATITLKVAGNSPIDAPIYTYYIYGKGDVHAISLMPTQEYFWTQDDGYTYRIHSNMVNGYTGPADWKLDGLTEANSVYFTNEEGTAQSDTYTGLTPYIKFTEAQTQPFTIAVDYYTDETRTDWFTYEDRMENDDGEYETTMVKADSSFNYFTIYPVKSGAPALRNIRVYSSDDADYYYPAYIAPGETTEVYFTGYGYGYDSDDASLTTNAHVTWSLVSYDESCDFTITENGDETNTATVTHACESDSCTAMGAVQVKVVYDTAYGQLEDLSEFYILPTDYSGDLTFGGDNGEDEYEPEFTLNGDTMPPMAQPAGTQVDVYLEYYDDIVNYYAISHSNNADLTPDENGYYTDELEEKEGLTVIMLPGTFDNDYTDQYFYGENIPWVNDDYDAHYPYTLELSDAADSSSVETVTFVAVEEYTGEVVAQLSTAVYDDTNHRYVGSNSANIEHEHLLIFESLDENGNSVGYCVANDEVIASSVKMYPATSYVTEGTGKTDFTVSGDFATDTADACTGSHGSSIDGAVLYNGEAELTEVSRAATALNGGTYSPVVKVDGEEKTVTSWRVKGNQSTGTYFNALVNDEGVVEDYLLNVGSFETAETLTLLATIEGEQFFTEFTVSVTDEATDLTDVSADYVLVYEDDSSTGELVQLSHQLSSGAIYDKISVISKAEFEQNGYGTLLNAANGMSLEVVGSNINILDISGSVYDEDMEEDIYFGVNEDGSIAFRTEDWTDETHTLYVIAYDEDGNGSYVKFDFTTDFEGE